MVEEKDPDKIRNDKPQATDVFAKFVDIKTLSIQSFDDSEERKETDQLRGNLAQNFLYDPQRHERLQKEEAGIFFCINPQENPAVRNRENTKEFARLGLDLDVAKEKDKVSEEVIVQRKQVLFQELKNLKIQPNFVIETKHGFQPVWCWEKPLPLPTVTDRFRANDYYHQIVAGLQKAVGLVSEGDSLVRALRLPGTYHLKDSNYPYKIKVFELNSTKVDFEDFINTYPPVKEYKKPLSEITGGSQKGTRNIDATAMVGSLLHRYPPEDWEGIVWPLFRAWNLTCEPPQNPKIIRDMYERLGKEDLAKRSSSKNTLDSQYSDGSVLSLEKFRPIKSTDLITGDVSIDWIWEGIVARGHLTLLSALWKIGKSTLVSLLLKVLEKGGEFAGQKVEKASVLIISEESGAIWARRIDEYGLETPFLILPRPITQRLSYSEWIQFLEFETKVCEEEKIDLLIIDTVSTFWNVVDESSAPILQAALLPINHLLKKGVAVLLVHHFRKSGGEEGTASRGSGALGSTVDIIAEFRRLPGEAEGSKRSLKFYSRFRETPLEIVIDLVDGEYITLGTRSDVEEQAKLQKVLRMFEEFPSGATIKDIFDNWDEDELGKRPAERTIQRKVKILLEKGEIIVVGERSVGKTKATIYSTNARQDRPTSIMAVDHKSAEKLGSPIPDTNTSPIKAEPIVVAVKFEELPEKERGLITKYEEVEEEEARGDENG